MRLILMLRSRMTLMLRAKNAKYASSDRQKTSSKNLCGSRKSAE